MDITKLRQAFPALTQKVNGQAVTFLDSAASALKPQPVLDAMNALQTTKYANIHRGLYDFSQHTTAQYEAARATVASFINAPRSEEIVFTHNATESINLVAQTWAKSTLKQRDRILLTRLEHHANIVPWQMLAEEKGMHIDVASPEKTGELKLQHIENAWQEGTKLLVITGMSNALGVKPDLAEIIPFAHSKGAKVLVDASQLIVHGGVDVQALGADFVVFTGHKLYGPTGVGVLWAHYDTLKNMPPYKGGGDMIETVSFSGTTYAPPPARFEAGTPNIVGVIGLKAAIDFLQQYDAQAIEKHEQSLLQHAQAGLKAIGGITLYGDVSNKGAVISFNIDGVHVHDVAEILNQCGVAVRTGHHCAMPLMEFLGVNGTVRASFGMYNTQDDVENLLKAVQQAKSMLS